MASKKALLLTEGYHGMISQVEGMAKALKAEFHHKIVRLNWPWNYIPPKFTPISQTVLKDKNYINDNEKIDLIISCGRKSVIPSIILKNRNKKIITIHIQDPKVNFSNFDLIIAPEHDSLNGENVISSKGAIHYITQEEIKKSQSYLEDKTENKKIVSLILGGPNKYYNFSIGELTKIFNEIKSMDTHPYTADAKTPNISCNSNCGNLFKKKKLCNCSNYNFWFNITKINIWSSNRAY